LIEFFAARQGEEEGLIFLMSRMNIMEKKILELGEAPTWEEIFCYRVLAALQPDKFDNLKSKIYQMPREEINIEKIKSMFQAEESWLMSKNATSSKNLPKVKIEEEEIEAFSASTERRKCTTLGCKGDMSRLPKKFLRCSKCQGNFVQREEEKKEKKEEVQNTKVSKKKKKSKKYSSTSESLDSSCSSC